MPCTCGAKKTYNAKDGDSNHYLWCDVSSASLSKPATKLDEPIQKRIQKSWAPYTPTLPAPPLNLTQAPHAKGCAIPMCLLPATWVTALSMIAGLGQGHSYHYWCDSHAATIMLQQNDHAAYVGPQLVGFPVWPGTAAKSCTNTQAPLLCTFRSYCPNGIPPIASKIVQNSHATFRACDTCYTMAKAYGVMLSVWDLDDQNAPQAP